MNKETAVLRQCTEMKDAADRHRPILVIRHVIAHIGVILGEAAIIDQELVIVQHILQDNFISELCSCSPKQELRQRPH